MEFSLPVCADRFMDNRGELWLCLSMDCPSEAWLAHTTHRRRFRCTCAATLSHTCGAEMGLATARSGLGLRLYAGKFSVRRLYSQRVPTLSALAVIADDRLHTTRHTTHHYCFRSDAFFLNNGFIPIIRNARQPNPMTAAFKIRNSRGIGERQLADLISSGEKRR